MIAPPAPPASSASRILAQAASLGGFGRAQAKDRAEEEVVASLDYEDPAEDLVDQPDGITRLAGVVADLGELAGRTVRAAAGGAAPPGRPRPGTRGTDDPDDDPPVQRIPVS